MSTSPLSVPIPSIEQASQNAARLFQESLAQSSQAAGPYAVNTATDLELARSNTKALAFIQGTGLHGAYRYLRDYIARQAVPIKSAKKFLDGWLETYGMPRKDASAAFGSAPGTGITGTLLPAGTLLQYEDGRQYRVVADVSVVGGVVTPSLIALVAGAAGNLPPGSPLTLVSPVAGIDSDFVADAVSGLSGGADRETDALAVYRLQQRLTNPPMGGSPADYANWALKIASITRAWGVRNPAGPTSAGVIIMADGNLPNGLPTEAQRLSTFNYIRDPKRGPPDELFVIIPTLDVIPFTIRLDADTPTTRQDTTDALADLFFREAVPGGKIPQSHAVEAISGVVGEYNHTIISPAITSGAFWSAAAFDHLLARGGITFVP
ncbi:MAG TPA: baseplate J/gp47 family protein [Variovorax sp.]